MSSPPSRILQKKLLRFFEHPSVVRGTEYFWNDSIQNFKSNYHSATAEIRGTEIYDTILDWSLAARTAELFASCTCAHFSKGHLCKHLWALVLEIDYRGLSLRISIRGTVQLLPVDSENDIVQRVLEHNQSQAPAKLDTPAPEPIYWREALNPSLTSPMGLFLEVDPSDRQSVIWRLTEKATNSSEDGISPRRIRQLKNPEIKAALTEIASLVSLEETNLSYRRRRIFSQGNEDEDRKLMKLKTQSLRLILPGILESVSVYAAGEPGVRLMPAQFGNLRLQVIETDEGFRLRGQIFNLYDRTQLATDLRELKLFSGADLYRHENNLGFLSLTDDEQSWFEILQKAELEIPQEDLEPFLDSILSQAVPVELPEILRWPLVSEIPLAQVRMTPEKKSETDNRWYRLDLQFQYGPRKISRTSEFSHIASFPEQKVYLRNSGAEQEFIAKLPSELIQTRTYQGEQQWVVLRKDLFLFAKSVLAAGIPLDIENKKIHTGKDFEISVTSGLDWFDVQGQVEFDGTWIKFPTLLEAAQRGESFVPMADGSFGMMSEALRSQLERLAHFSEASGEGLRFNSSQGLLLHALLESEPSVNLDQKFQKLRDKVRSFSGLSAKSASSGFQGSLRPYQEEGLGWLEFLEDFGLGGILADDMGLGKTIQFLAFLQARIQNGESTGPSLLVAPKSLLSNWQSEAQKFTPQLRTLILAGTDREKLIESFQSHDLIITTYQTVLRDLDSLRKINWDCLILDEAQAIKNSKSLVAKAVKILPAHFRLAMTGTPIENSIQDLFSISDFVNPGFLEHQGGKRKSGSKSKKLAINPEMKGILAKAFKPVILRRTKEQVLQDLPSKIEQTVRVELEPQQLQFYNELKKFYKGQILQTIQDQGLKNSKIEILSALTRLRQAALHPGLIDPTKATAKSAKFEAVLEMLEQLIAEKHRVLIFSQFTGLLGLLKRELELRQMAYCYLDGKTTKRKQVVDSFTLGSAPIFLISLKAGGVGLNLVEADYVFLLDPWWNPAVEAQAISRAHRIGQKQVVNAYRFIAKDTVEEKILDLQKTKLGLSQEILDGSDSLIRTLTRQDIEDLF